MELKPISDCRTVAELLADKSRWTTNANAKDNFGNHVRPVDESACCFCVRGAMHRITGENVDRIGLAPEYHKMWDKFSEAINSSEVTLFNDTHTYEEVYAKVIEAGI